MDKKDKREAVDVLAPELTEAQRGELLRRADAHRRHPGEAVLLDDALHEIERSLDAAHGREHGPELDGGQN